MRVCASDDSTVLLDGGTTVGTTAAVANCAAIEIEDKSQNLNKDIAIDTRTIPTDKTSTQLENLDWFDRGCFACEAAVAAPETLAPSLEPPVEPEDASGILSV